MTNCSTAFAKPKWMGGDPDLAKLRSCLKGAGISFSTDRPFGGGSGPTCMDCWTDDIMCDANKCKLACIGKFLNPNNTGDFAGCLKCDEEKCGPGFIKCAGANRRSSGIFSDIARASDQVCDQGWFYGCSQCHKACAKGDTACAAACDKDGGVCRLSGKAAAPVMPAPPARQEGGERRGWFKARLVS